MPFQSTPTSFPVGDKMLGAASIDCTGFNPRPPVSRWATVRIWSTGRMRTFQSTPTSFPVGDVREDWTQKSPLVSIHAHQFPGGRPRRWRGARRAGTFQSTPTSFPVGDVTKQQIGQVLNVSIHAHQFPGGRPQGACCWGCCCGFNPRPPVSRWATLPGDGLMIFKGMFQSTPTSFPVGDKGRPGDAVDYDEFQSTPTSFPVGDLRHASTC
ncbi:MAG: hypothetical protein RIQ60_2632 [Pseudomonadota bacterium]